MSFNPYVLIGAVSKLVSVGKAHFDDDQRTTVMGELKKALGQELGNPDGLDDAALNAILNKVDTSAVFGVYEKEAEQKIVEIYELAAKAQAEKIH